MKYTKVDVDILKKYMEAVVKVVEKKISVCLPDTFALMFAGWSDERTNSFAIYAICSSTKAMNRYDAKRLLFSL